VGKTALRPSMGNVGGLGLVRGGKREGNKGRGKIRKDSSSGHHYISGSDHRCRGGKKAERGEKKGVRVDITGSA